MALTRDQAFDTALNMYRDQGVQVDMVDRTEGVISGRLIQGNDEYRLNMTVEEIPA